MTNIALCFDEIGDRNRSTGATNAATTAAMLHSDDDQIVWSRGDADVTARYRSASRHRQSAALGDAHAAVVEAYELLVERWERGDRIYLFGAGRGAYCARALTRLLGTVGVVSGPDPAGWTTADFREYVLSAYAMPRTRRSASDWQLVGQLAAQLFGRSDHTVDVAFLGLWDMVGVPGLPRADAADPLVNVIAGRHAVAIDSARGPFGGRSRRPTAEGFEEVWFRGAHSDVAGGHNACTPLSDIALDWILDGAMKAGATVRPNHGPAPCADDALAGGAHPVSFRKVPADAVMHASVERYLRAHPSYWRRLPACVAWADPEWDARSERLMPAPTPPVPPPALTAAS